VELESLRRENQRILVEFLRGDLDLARTFLDLARWHLKNGDHEGYDRILRKTQRAIESIHHFEGEISDPKVRAELQYDLESLEKDSRPNKSN
jgi:hypothetical protein